MKIYLSTTSPYSRLVLIAALLTKKNCALEFVLPWENPAELTTVNPYSSIPVFIDENQQVITETLLILNKIDENFRGDSKSAFAFTTINCATKTYALQMHQDKNYPAHPHIERGLNALQKALPQAPKLEISENWGDIILAVALDYISLRFPEIYENYVTASNKEALKRFREHDLLQKSASNNLNHKPKFSGDL